MTSLTVFTPSGIVAQAAPLRLAAKRLGALGFDVAIDASALARHQRFGGDDATRLEGMLHHATWKRRARNVGMNVRVERMWAQDFLTVFNPRGW